MAITQHELLTMICEALHTHNGHEYRISYAPMRNLSEQRRPEIFYFVKPQMFSKEAIIRGSLTSVHEIVIAHVGVIEGNGDTPIITAQNEMDQILNLFCGANNPLKSQGFWVSKAESGPVFSSPVSGDALEAEIRLLCAAVAITFKR